MSESQNTTFLLAYNLMTQEEILLMLKCNDFMISYLGGSVIHLFYNFPTLRDELPIVFFRMSAIFPLIIRGLGNYE